MYASAYMRLNLFAIFHNQVFEATSTGLHPISKYKRLVNFISQGTVLFIAKRTKETTRKQYYRIKNNFISTQETA